MSKCDSAGPLSAGCIPKPVLDCTEFCVTDSGVEPAGITEIRTLKYPPQPVRGYATPKRIYLAGPMRGYNQCNFPAFDAAAKRLRARGYTVISPADIDRACGIDPADENFSLEAFNLKPVIQRDVDAILECDGVALLPGWEKSTGAFAELAVARWLGLPLFDAEDMSPISFDDRVLIIDKPEHPLPLIVGFNGFGGVGKDEAAKALEQFGWEKIGFADPMYEIALILNPLLRVGIFLLPLRWIVKRRGWIAAKRIPAVRKYLQTLGTEAGREVIGEDVWLSAAAKRLKPGGRYVITNVRFQNEEELIRRLGGIVIGIDRPGYKPVNAHKSEHIPIRRDITILNDGPREVLWRRVLAAVENQYPGQCRGRAKELSAA